LVTATFLTHAVCNAEVQVSEQQQWIY